MGREDAPRWSYEVLALRAWYLLFFAGQYAQNFLPLVFAQVMSFSPAEIGALTGFRRIANMVFAPVFTFLCDSTHAHRSLLAFSLTAYYSLCVILSTQRSLTAVGITLGLREMVSAGADATVNAAAVASLAEKESEITFASLRLYGSIGWGAMSFLGSVLLDAFFHSDMRFILCSQAVIGIGVIFLVTRALNLSPELFIADAERRRSSVDENAGAHVEDGSRRGESLAWYAKVAIFAANVLMVGVVAGILQTSLFLYCASLAVPNSVMGLSILLNCSVEAVCFWFHGSICTVLGGAEIAFRLSIVINAAQLVALANIHKTASPSTAFLACMTFGGVAFALFWPSAVQICAAMAPHGRETFAQGVLSALNWGLGAALGCVAAGKGMQSLGTPAMYLLVSGSQLATLTIPIAVCKLCTVIRKRAGYDEIKD